MQQFKYKVKNKDGKSLTGIIEARDVHQAVTILRERGLVIVRLKPARERFSLIRVSALITRVKFVDVVNFFRQMATMINAGLPLTSALSLLESQVAPSMKSVVTDLLGDVEGGKSLSDAMEKHPRVFNNVYVALVRAGEAAGKLDEMLTRLADNLEKQREFRSKTKGAMIYPAIILLGMFLVSAIMMIFVIPRMTDLFEDFGAELPFLTRLLVVISDFVSSFWYVALGGGLLIWWMLRIWKATPLGRKAWDSFSFKIPIWGNLQKQILMSEFCRTLGLLVGSGVSIVDGLDITSDIMGNALYSDSIKEASARVEKGIPIASTFANFSHFPSIVSQMIAVGEETGKVDEVLLKLAKYFETESEQLIKSLTTAIEPLIMIVLGIGVGFLVLAVIMPIYNLTSQL